MRSEMGNNMHPESLKGYFIISESNMLDPNFFQTVVLLIEHNSDGAFGLVVNRRAKITLGDIIPTLANTRGFTTPLYVGGPVQQEFLFALHSELPEILNGGSPETTVVAEGVFFEPNFRKLEHYFIEENWQAIPADDQPHLNLYLGYSGWAPGQLEKEMSQGSWIIHQASKKIVFHENPEEGWRDALRAKGGIYQLFADSKQEPHLN